MLFKNQDEVRQFIRTTVSYDFEDIKPIIELQVEPLLKRNLLGTATYNSLNAKYTSNQANLTADEKELLKHCRNYIANESYLRNIAPSNLKQGIGGLQVVTTPEAAPASQYRTEELKKYFATASGEAEENLLLFLEEKKAVFTDWASSDQFTVLHECFINTADDFSKNGHEINGSRKLFKALRTIMLRNENKVKKAIGKPLFDAIKAEIKSGNVSSNNADLLLFIKMAVAKYTIAEALFELNLIIAEDGVRMAATVAVRETVKEERPAGVTDKSILARACIQVADQQMADLKSHLDKNVNTYQLYKDSSAYVSPTSGTGILGDKESGTIML